MQIYVAIRQTQENTPLDVVLRFMVLCLLCTAPLSLRCKTVNGHFLYIFFLTILVKNVRFRNKLELVFGRGT